MHYLYIIENAEHKNYTGVAKDVDKRLHDHNLGIVKSTKYGHPWQLVHKETATLSDAKKREWFLKCTPQGQKLKKKILETAGIPAQSA